MLEFKFIGVSKIELVAQIFNGHINMFKGLSTFSHGSGLPYLMKAFPCNVIVVLSIITLALSGHIQG